MVSQCVLMYDARDMQKFRTFMQRKSKQQKKRMTEDLEQVCNLRMLSGEWQVSRVFQPLQCLFDRSYSHALKVSLTDSQPLVTTRGTTVSYTFMAARAGFTARCVGATSAATTLLSHISLIRLPSGLALFAGC